jgi:hypothetical protein
MENQNREKLAEKFREAGAKAKVDKAHVISRSGKWVLDKSRQRQSGGHLPG